VVDHLPYGHAPEMQVARGLPLLTHLFIRDNPWKKGKCARTTNRIRRRPGTNSPFTAHIGDVVRETVSPGENW